MLTPEEKREVITEDWLREIGFKWEQFQRQPDKQWLLWLGDALVDESTARRRMFSSYEDLGVELSFNPAGLDGPYWNCWVRSDSSHRYHRFVHVRYLIYRDELVRLIEGLTGRSFVASDCLYGSFRSPDEAARLRAESERLDRRIHRSQHAWSACEKDEDRGRPTVAHVQAAIDGGKAK